MGVTATVGNPRFFANTGPHSLCAVAAAIGCDAPAADAVISGLASLESAGHDQISFLANRKSIGLLGTTKAGAVLLMEDMRAQVPPGVVPLVTRDPVASWGLVAALFHPVRAVTGGVHRSAVVADSAVVDASAQICANAVIGERAEIGAGSCIGPGAVIGDGVVIGASCHIGAQASISHATLGARVYIYPGARIGQEGFGFTISASGFTTTPQLACVVIGDDVEIGANSTIDRGALHDTVIGAGTRIDNLVQVAHGVTIGRYCAIASQVGISGSAVIDDFVVIGGQAGVADHMHIGTKSRVGAQSGVMSEIEPGSVVVSSPARPVREVFREIALLKKMAAKK